MNILLAAIASVALQQTPAAPAAHTQHSPPQQAQQQSQEHKCCKHVNGKMECAMMKGHQGHGKDAVESPGAKHRL